MQVLNDALHGFLSEAADRVVCRFLADELRQREISLSAKEIEQLAEAIRSGQPDPIVLRRWRSWEREGISLDLTEADAERLEAKLSAEVIDRIPEFINSLQKDVTIEILAQLRKRWPKEFRRQRKDVSSFRRRLRKRWKEPLSLLALHLAIAREFGGSVNAESRGSRAENPHQIEVITRLHARSCQLTDEILSLLAAGFADGAMARWRVLHEVAVVALLVSRHDDLLAERYLAHAEVESWRAITEYSEFSERLGYPPVSAEEFAEVRDRYDRVIARFGSDFGLQYGWAAEIVDSRRPRFADIERAVGTDHLRPHYRMASHAIHANPKGVLFKLGLLDGVEGLLAGPSDVGLADPGHSTAISLAQASSCLLTLSPSFDHIVLVGAMHLLQDEIGSAFLGVHQAMGGT